MPDRGDPQAVEAYLELLVQDPDTSVKVNAVEALGSISARGDRKVLRSLAKCVNEDGASSVKLAAVRAIGLIAEPGDPLSVRVLADCLDQDSDLYIRKAAITALGKVATEGDTVAVEVLLRRIEEDPAEGIRMRSMDLLGRLAVKGDRRVVETLICKLEAESEGEQKKSAASALGAVAMAGDASVSAALKRCLTGPNSGMNIFADAVSEALRCIEETDGAATHSSPAREAEVAEATAAPPLGGGLAPRAKRDEMLSGLQETFKSSIGQGHLDREGLDRLVGMLLSPELSKQALDVLSPQLDTLVDTRTGKVDVYRFVQWLCV